VATIFEEPIAEYEINEDFMEPIVSASQTIAALVDIAATQELIGSLTIFTSIIVIKYFFLKTWLTKISIYKNWK